MQGASTATPRIHSGFMRRLMRADIHAARLACFIAALAVYALAGSPTPDDPGLAEIAIAVLLVFAAGAGAARDALRFDMKAPAWRAAGTALLIYGLCAGVAVGALRGNDTVHMLRDILPFLFLLLPLFFTGLARDDRTFGLMTGAVAALGFIFALRALAAYQGNAAALLAQIFGETQELAYFANAPTVLFAALIMFGATGEKFIREFSPRALVMFALGCALAVVTLLPVALTMQRASLGYAAVYVAALGGLAFFRHPARCAMVLLMFAGLCLPFWAVIAGVFDSLAQKTALVGVNARGAELAAVWHEIGRNPASLLFGTGWGGMFESPAVANIRVNYTHSLLSSMLLKTGLAGFILAILYIGGLAGAVSGRLKANPVLALALLGPILIDSFLYASFKSLDFGLILLLASGALAVAAKLHKGAGCCIQEDINPTPYI